MSTRYVPNDIGLGLPEYTQPSVPQEGGKTPVSRVAAEALKPKPAVKWTVWHKVAWGSQVVLGVAGVLGFVLFLSFAGAICALLGKAMIPVLVVLAIFALFGGFALLCRAVAEYQ